MTVINKCVQSDSFNNKSELVVNKGGRASMFDHRENTALSTPASSGVVETKYDGRFDSVAYYAAPSGDY